MRRIRLSLYVALALCALAYSASVARAEPCTVAVGVHNHASVWLKGQKLASCDSAAGCTGGCRLHRSGRRAPACRDPGPKRSAGRQ